MASTQTAERSTSGQSSKVLSKGLALIEAIVSDPIGEISLAQLARATDMPKPTVHRLLGVLVDHGLVIQSEAEGYRLGVQSLVWGTRFLERIDLRREAAPVLQRLVEQSGESVHLGLRDRTQVIYIEKYESPQPVRMFSRVGASSPLYSTGIGKAILAYADAQVVDAVVATGLLRRTPNTITSESGLRRELERVRQQGYAVDNIENEEGIRCIAAPVMNHKGECIAGISVAGPSFRMTKKRIQSLCPSVLDSALELCRLVGYESRPP